LLDHIDSLDKYNYCDKVNV